MENEMENMNNLVKKFNEQFGNVDPSTLTGETKKLYNKLKTAVDRVASQRDMMGSVLDTMSEFGVKEVMIGSKIFSKVQEPTEEQPEPRKYTPSQFDDIMNDND